jgi:hypothetical protein
LLLLFRGANATRNNMTKDILKKTRWLFTAMAGIVMLSSFHKHCVPVQCVTVLAMQQNGKPMSVTEFWAYDSLGRLIVDSINEPDKIWAPVSTEYFHYSGDSIFGNGEHNFPGIDSIIIKITKEGFPVMTSISPNHGGDYFVPYYNADGTINMVKSTRQNGSAVVYTTIDSIVYSDGDIVSYHSKSGNGDNFIAQCTYYSDKLYSQPFNPTYKMLGVSNGLIPLQGIFNVQVYSKNLIKTMEFNGVNRRYEYQVDEDGKVIHMNITFKDAVYTHTNKYSFKYSCEN